MTRKVAALCTFVFVAMLAVPIIGCSEPGGGPLGVSSSFGPNAGDCSTDLTLNSTNTIDPKTSVIFQGVVGTGTEGLSETVGVSPTATSNKALVHAPCDQPQGLYDVIVLPPTGAPFKVGQFQRI